mgnify:CR=1 FL=1
MRRGPLLTAGWALLFRKRAGTQSLTFVFEYIAEMGKDYIYAVTPLLEDALIDRDLVHRQTASTVVKRTRRHRCGCIARLRGRRLTLGPLLGRRCGGPAAARADMAMGCFGLGREDALIHLLNVVWPNIFETSPHVINAVMDAIEGLRVALGPARILQYTLQVRFAGPRRGCALRGRLTLRG